MDKKYLFKRNNVWWVKLAVPLHLRDKLGFDLRKSTGEKTLDKALLKRDIILNDLKSKFSEGSPESSNIKSILPRKTTYFDYASTTPVDERVIDKMKECLSFEGLSLIHI